MLIILYLIYPSKAKTVFHLTSLHALLLYTTLVQTSPNVFLMRKKNKKWNGDILLWSFYLKLFSYAYLGNKILPVPLFLFFF